MAKKRSSIGWTLAAVLLVAHSAAAEQVIFLVRHAERAPAPPSQTAAPGHGMMADDPSLSPEGEQRAARLAAMLAFAQIKHIYTTEYRRTRQTADPLAKHLKLTPIMSAAKDPDPLIAQVRRDRSNVLIVGHANTVPDLLKKLGVAETITIGDNEYDNLFVVFRDAAGKTTLARLKY